MNISERRLVTPQSFVLRPNEPNPGANVFATWAALYAACSGIQGGMRVVVDAPLSSPAHIPAGTWNLQGNWTFVGSAQDATGTGVPGSVLQFDDGAILTGPGGLLSVAFGEALAVIGTYATPVISCGNGQEANIEIRENVQLVSQGTAPFVAHTGTGTAYVTVRGATVGDGTNAAFTSESASGGGELVVWVRDGGLSLHAFQSLSGGNGYLHYGESALIGIPQDGMNLLPTANSAAILAVSTTGGTTTVQSTSEIIEVTGALTSNATIELPAITGMQFLLYNGTSGGFSVTFQPSGGTGFALAQGKRAIAYVNASGVLVQVTAAN